MEASNLRASLLEIGMMMCQVLHQHLEYLALDRLTAALVQGSFFLASFNGAVSGRETVIHSSADSDPQG